ncbi:MAG: hypothetical protein Q9164_006165 [Protoblastenia rupestris]
MSASPDGLLLPTRRPPYIRAHSTGGDNFDARSDASEAPLVPRTTNQSGLRIVPEQVSHRTIFLRLLFPWIGTILFTASVVGLVFGFRAKGVITPTQKSTYNLLVTVLILILGLNFFEAFKELARHMRGDLSRLFGLQGEEQELMHGFDSLLKVARLILITSKWPLRAFCVFWLREIRPGLLLALAFRADGCQGAQMLSALINLEVTVDDGHDFNGTFIRPGEANVSKIGCYYHNDNCLGTKHAVTMHGLAHIYGDMKTAAPDRGDYNQISDLLQSRQDFSVWRRTDQTQFAHRFNEYNKNDTRGAYPYFTDRIITSSSGECIEYQAHKKTEDAIMGGVKANKITYSNASIEGTILIPVSALGKEGTTYIYLGLNDPSLASDPRVVCGNRCMYVWVYENPGAKSSPKLYQCPITVSVVSNAKLPEHDIPDSLARVAAVSIALEGRYQGPHDNQDFHQYQYYASGTPYEVHFQNNKRIGANIASFAMGSLASMVEKNPKILLPGMVPYLGSRLQVNTPALTAILVCLHEIQKWKHGVKQSRKRLKELAKTQETYGDTDAEKHNRIWITEILEKHLDYCERLKPADIYIGNIVAGSGYRSCGRQKLDWAIVEVEKARVGENRLFDESDILQYHCCYASRTIKEAEDIDSPDGTVPYCDCFKIGRSSGITAGSLNPIKTCVNWALIEEKKAERSQMKGRRTQKDIPSCHPGLEQISVW